MMKDKQRILCAIKWMLLLVVWIYPLFVSSQNVVVTLTGWLNGARVELDTIILENWTQPNSVVLSPLPSGIKSYEIDLVKGKVINAIDNLNNKSGIHVESNQPGLLRLRNVSFKDELVEFRLVTLSGATLLYKEISCHSGSNLVEVKTGNNPLLVLNIKSNTLNYSIKCTGSLTGYQELGINMSCSSKGSNQTQEFAVFRTNSDFIFAPGDAVKFTAIRSGYYSNNEVNFPADQDSINIPLSIPCPGQPFVIDYDNNVYPTVQIGSQCWFRENVRSKHYADGTPLTDGTGAGNIRFDFTTPYWFDYNDDPSNSYVYGRLYTAAAVMKGESSSQWDTVRHQGICPVGWHMPKDKEWMRLEACLGMLDTNNCMHCWRGTDQGNKLKEADPTHWGPYYHGSNSSGFSALPAGIRSSNGDFKELGITTVWWIGTSFGNYTSDGDRMLWAEKSHVYRGATISDAGFSCRCVKD